MFTALAVRVVILLEKDGVKPKPGVKTFSASLDRSPVIRLRLKMLGAVAHTEKSKAPPTVYEVETEYWLENEASPMND